MAFVEHGIKMRLKKRTGKDGLQEVALLYINAPGETPREPTAGVFREASEAMAWAPVFAKEEAARREGPAPVVNAGLCGTTLEEYFVQWLPLRELTQGGRNHYVSAFKNLQPVFGHLDIRLITEARVTAFVSGNGHQGKLSNNSVNVAVKALGTILYAKEGAAARKVKGVDGQPLCLVNPVHDVQRKKRGAKRKPEIYTPEEMQVLIPCAGPWFLPLLATLYDTGARKSEARALLVSDLLRSGKMSITKVINEDRIENAGTGTPWYPKPSTKDVENREIKLTPETITMLRAMIAERNLGPNDLLFAAADERKQSQRRRARQTAILDYVEKNPGATVQDIATAVEAKYAITRLDVKVLKDEGCLGNMEALNGWQDRFVLRTKERKRCVEIARTDTWPNGVPFSNGWLFKEWKAAVLAAGLPWRRVHDVRASAISELMGGTGDVSSIKAFTGHSDLATSERYNVAHDFVADEALAARQRSRERYAAAR